MGQEGGQMLPRTVVWAATDSGNEGFVLQKSLQRDVYSKAGKTAASGMARVAKAGSSAAADATH